MSESSTTQTQAQSDNRMVLGEAAMVAQGGSTIINNTLDGEVVNKAFSFGSDALDFASTSQTKAYSFATEAGERALDSLNTTSNLVKDAYADAKGRGALTDKILIGAIAMAGIVAFAAVRK